MQLNERLKREGIKTHKERVEELNRYLSNLSEHHDMYVILHSRVVFTLSDAVSWILVLVRILDGSFEIIRYRHECSNYHFFKECSMLTFPTPFVP